MIALRIKISLTLTALLSTLVGFVVWAAPAYAQEFSVDFECTSSGADVTFTNEETSLGIAVFWGSFEEQLGGFELAAGDSETFSTDLDTLYYTVRELQGDPASESGSIDLSSCSDPGDDDDDDDDEDDDDDDDDAPHVAPDAGV